MNPIKLTEEELIDLWREEGLVDSEGNDVFELVIQGIWNDGGKIQSSQIIFKDVRDGKHYSFDLNRSGSYFSHYEYEVWDEPVEVELQEKLITIKRWVEV